MLTYAVCVQLIVPHAYADGGSCGRSRSSGGGGGGDRAGGGGSSSSSSSSSGFRTEEGLSLRITSQVLSLLALLVQKYKY
jgi:hypothetical protein